MYVYVYIHIYIYTCVRVICVYVCMCMYIYICMYREYIEILQDLRTMIKQSQVDHPHRSESNDHLAPWCFSVTWAAAVGHDFSGWFAPR